MDYSRALISAAEGKAILFVGAGFSRGATSLDNEGFPDGWTLAGQLCEASDVPSTNDLKVASNRYLKVKDPEDLIRLLKEKFTAKTICDFHSSIASIPWKGIYTTNYDNILEIGAAERGKKLTPLTLADDPRHYRKSVETVLHINGYIDRLHKGTLLNEFKLTNTSYLTTQFRESNWSEIFTRQLQSAQAIFFVGYSLYDLDIQEILFADQGLRQKTFFIQKPGMTVDEMRFSDLADFGEIMSIGVSQFADDLINVDLSAISMEAQFVPVGFEESRPLPTEKHVAGAVEIFDLLLRGEVNSELVTEQVMSGTKNEYLFNRDALEYVGKNYENYVLSGDLGNGKTTLLLALCADFQKRGFRVFWLKDQAYDCFDEIEEIIDLGEPVVIVFDNYTRKMKLVAHANLKRRANTVMMLSARSALHKNYEESLFFKDIRIDLSRTCEIDCNKLSKEEIENVVEYFAKYGLWGEMAAAHYDKKVRYIQYRCSSELHAVLLDLLASPEIQSRFSSFFNDIKEMRSFTQTMIAAFALNLLNITEPTAHMIAAMSNDSSIFNPSFKSNPAIRQFFNNESGVIRPKSSALAEFALTNFPDPQALVDMLIEICVATRKKAEVSDFYWDLYRDLASFSNIQRMLPTNNKEQLLIRFYEGLRKIELERSNPLFWLQYAMARMNFPSSYNLEQAEKYLTTALAFGRAKKNYTTVDIETQHARYHLEYAANVATSVDDAFFHFMKANTFLSNITRIEIYKNEPFRPIRLYEAFYKKFLKLLSEPQRQGLLTACSQIFRNIQQLPPRTADDKNVILARKSVENVIAALASSGK
ncbi:hypothetical protein G3257_15800 [Janthinobacterium lividum]|uniref:P-loop NTPase n=1 Tax=Janthinobacterium lividum TaxID=29581 RepID=UPI001595B96A|nr:SIR2 family protein [Janthinobacterium lividum]QKY03573.1 hypothetical protein G3257_15800 [Janthinobacterium lividum]